MSYIRARSTRVEVSDEDHDGRIRRVDFPVGRVVRKVRRELAPRGVDRRLDVARGRVDVAVQVELDRDVGRAEPGRRGHLRDAGDAAELTLERRRDGGGHRVRGSLPASRTGR